MPANPTTANVSVIGRQPPGDLFGLPIFVAADSSDSDTNKVKKYFDPDSLRAVHGTSTKIGIAADYFFKNRGRAAVTIKPVKTAVVAEAHGTSQSGTLTNNPITNSTPPVIRRDTVSMTVVPTYEDPITSTPPVGSVLVNFYTGDYKFNSAPSTSSDADYSYYDFTPMVQNLLKNENKLGPFELLYLPGTPASKANFGDLKALAEIAKTNFWFLVIETASNETVANGKAFREAMANSHAMLADYIDATSGIDPGAIVLGVMSRTNPFTSVALKPLTGFSALDYFLPSDIGKVETADTYEGEGINVVHRIGPFDVLTNERTCIAYTPSNPDAADAKEIYASRVRAKINLRARLKAAGDLLLVTADKIGNDQKGVGAYKGECTKVMEGLIAENGITRDYSITEPPFQPDSRFSATVADAKARRLGPFKARAIMVESSHELVVDAFLEVSG